MDLVDPIIAFPVMKHSHKWTAEKCDKNGLVVDLIAPLKLPRNKMLKSDDASRLYLHRILNKINPETLALIKSYAKRQKKS